MAADGSPAIGGFYSDDQVFGPQPTKAAAPAATSAPVGSFFTDDQVFGTPQKPAARAAAPPPAPSQQQTDAVTPQTVLNDTSAEAEGPKPTNNEGFLEKWGEGMVPPDEGSPLVTKALRSFATETPGQIAEGAATLFGPSTALADSGWPLPEDVQKADEQYDPTKSPIYQAGEKLQDVGRKILPTSDEFDQSIPGQIAGVVGALPWYVVGGIPGAVAAGGLSSAGSAAEEAAQKKATPSQQRQAAAGDFVIGAAGTAIPVETLLRPILRATPGLFDSIVGAVKNAIRSGVIGATTMSAMQLGSNLVEKQTFNPDKDVMEGVPQAAATGAAAFGVPAAVRGATSAIPAPRDQGPRVDLSGGPTVDNGQGGPPGAPPAAPGSGPTIIDQPPQGAPRATPQRLLPTPEVAEEELARGPEAPPPSQEDIDSVLGFGHPTEGTRDNPAIVEQPGGGPTRRAAITPMAIDQFKSWLNTGDTTKPVAPIRPAVAPAPPKVAAAPVPVAASPPVDQWATEVADAYRTQGAAAANSKFMEIKNREGIGFGPIHQALSNRAQQMMREAGWNGDPAAGPPAQQAVPTPQPATPTEKIDRIAQLQAERDAEARGERVAGSPAQSFQAIEQASRAEQPMAQAPVESNAAVTENEARNGVEVRFKAKPQQSEIDALKAAGFRWSGPQKLWYAKRSPTALKAVERYRVAPGGAEAPLKPVITPVKPPVVTPQVEPIAGTAPIGVGPDIQVQRGFGGMRNMFQARVRSGSHAGVVAWGNSIEDAKLEVSKAIAERERIGVGVPKLPEGGWTEIGKNAEGKTLYQDQRGVRHIVENGIRRSEPVSMVPTREGVQIGTDRDAHPEFKTAEEAAPSHTQSDYGKSNKTFTEDAAEKARARLRAKMGRLNTGLDPEMMQDLATLAGYHIEAGARAFGDFAKAMIGDMGDAVRPYLRGAYENIRHWPGFDVSGMTPAEEIARLQSKGYEPTSIGLPEETGHGVQGNLPRGDEGQGPGAVQPASAVGQAADLRAGPERGGPQAARTGVGGGEPVAQRGAGEPVRATERGGEGAGANAGLPRSAEPGQAGAERRHQPDAEVQGTNLTLTPGLVDEGRSFRQKAIDNVKAVEIAKQIVAEGRLATREEQEQLAKYVGWGGLPGAFRGSDNQFGRGFEQTGLRLQQLLTPDEYRTAARSTQYAHYTSEPVIRAMWDAVADMGFKGGHVLEPGMGIGHFIGMAPPDIMARSKYQGIELDHLTAQIAKLIYPKAGIRQADFTRVPIPENTFDLAIGNPPFSDTVIQSDPKYAGKGFMLHDYFFAKSIDSVRPGGLVAYVTSAGTMNKINPAARNYLAERAEFVGGARLPSTAFKKNAGTDVTTDILFFKKRSSPVDVTEPPDWAQTVPKQFLNPRTGVRESIGVSRYFSEHPEQVLGTEGLSNTQYATSRYGVEPIAGQDLETELRAALGRLPKNVMEDRLSPEQKAELDLAAPEKKDGSFYLQNGKVMQYSGGAGRPVERRGAGVEGGMTAPEMERVTHMVPIRDALRDVLKHDLAENAEGAAAARKELNAHYDAFVQKFGPINKATFQFRRPNVIQQESARTEAREAARMRGDDFDEGSFDPGKMIDQGATLQQIAAARREARERLGPGFKDGTFDPAEMPDTIIEKRPNIDPFMDDPESYRLRAIEDYNDSTGDAKKRRIFTESVLSRQQEPEIKSANDGVLWSLNKHGRLDLDAIAEKMGTDRQSVINELGDAIFKEPGTDDTYTTQDEYLSGDVVSKLETAMRLAERDPEIRRNVPALQAVQPAPLAPSEITMGLGMPWMPPATIQDFAHEIGLGPIRAAYNKITGAWTVRAGMGEAPRLEEWRTPDVTAHNVLTNALNKSPPRIYRTERDIEGRETRVFDPVASQAVADKIDAMKEAFTNWLEGDEDRAGALATKYNSEFNRVVLRKYDGSYLTTPGVAADWSWRPHQRRVVARIILSGNTYAAHAVGAGKTSEYIGAGMEMRRLGLVNKPGYIVPNHMLGQFTKEFYEQYPLAKIMVADERRFHTSRRKQFIANVAQSDLDAVIITHSSFGKIQVSDEFQNQLIQEQVDLIDEALSGLSKGEDRITIKRLENQKEKMEQKLSARGGKGKDQGDTFEQLGMDFLFVDEAQEFRKLTYATKQGSIKGIDPDGSDKAWDLYTKIRYLESQNPGRSVVLGSGTPVTNTMGELYTISRYLQQEELEKRGLAHFDSWASTFGDLRTQIEQTPAGTFAPVTRFAKFVNMPELFKMVGANMDIVTPEQLEQYVVRPKVAGGKRQLHLAPQTDTLKAYQQVLADRIQAIKDRKGPPKKGDDILLSVINDGRHAAIDPRFVNPMLRTDPSSKLNQMIDNAHRIWKETKNQGFYDPATNYQKLLYRGPAAQMIFSNLGIGEGEGARPFSGYRWMKEDLIRRGVPPNEIAFIKDFKTAVAKQKLFNDVNEGKVRILIGSTQKMGTGVNAQRRLAAIHNLDPLWFPSDDTQRNGRGIRQGNLNPEIQIHDYSTMGTYDATMWQMMGSKGRFIEQFFRGDPELREMEDLGEAGIYEQAAAMAISDPRVITLTEKRQALDKALRRQSAHDREQYTLKARSNSMSARVEYLDERIPHIEKDIAQHVDTTGDKFSMEVAGKTYDKRKDAADAISAFYNDKFDGLGKDQETQVGTIGGFPLWVYKDDKAHPSFFLKRNGGRDDEIGGATQGAGGIIASAEHRLRGLDGDLAYAKKDKAETARALAAVRGQIGKKFAGGDEIKQLRSEVKELEAAIAPKQEKPKLAGGTEEEPPPTGRPQGTALQHGNEESREAAPGEVQLNDDLTAQLKPSDKFTKAEAKIAKGVEAALARIAPGARPILAERLRSTSMPEPDSGTNVTGAYFKADDLSHVIAWSLESEAPLTTARHEAIHYLYRSGLLNDDEWKTLTDGAENGDWIGQHNIKDRYPQANHELQLEEAIADHYARWKQEGGILSRLPAWLRPIFAKIDQFRRAIATIARRYLGKDATPDDVFSKVESGEVGRRPYPIEEQWPQGTAFETPEREGVDRLENMAEQKAGALKGSPPGTIERQIGEMAPSRDMNKNLNLIEPLSIFPRTVASMDTKSARFWNAWKARGAEQQVMLHNWRNAIKPTFLALDKEGRENVYAAEELARLNGQAPEDDGRLLGMRNDDHPLARKSKVGDSILLDAKETRAFFERREMFAQAWSDIMRGAAKRLGWNGDASSAAVSEAAEKATGFAKTNLERVADVMKAMEEQQRTGYVPFMRFGDHYIAVSPKPGFEKESLGGFPETTWFETVERPALNDLIGKALAPGEMPKAVADRIAELQKQFPADEYNIRSGQLSKSADILRSLDIPAVEKLLMMTEGGVEREVKAQVKAGTMPEEAGKRLDDIHEHLFDELRREMYEGLKAGFKKKAKNTPGYSEDFDRITGSYMHWASKNAAEMIHHDAIERAYDDIQDKHPHQAIKHYWRDWRRYQEDPESLLSHAAQSTSQLGAVYALGMNPSTSAIIGLHTPMASGPALSVGAGAKTAAMNLGAALAHAYQNAKFDLKRGAHIDVVNAGQTPDEKAFLTQMVKEQLLGPRGADDLRALNDSQSELWGPAKSIMRRALDIATSNVSVVDQANRTATALAAYRAAKNPALLAKMADGWKDNQIFRGMVQRDGLTPATFGRFMLSEAAFDWGKENAPKAGRGMGRLFLNLHGFQTRFLSTAWKMMTRMGPAGRIALLYMGAGLLAGAGIEGIPFTQDIENLVDFLSKKFFSYDPMISAHIRSALAGAGFGKVGAEAIMRGPIGTLLGIDLSSRIGFGDVISRELSGITSGAELLGTTPSIIIGRINAALKSGRPSELLPSGIRNPVTAARQAETGVKSNSGKTTYVPAGKLSAADAAKRALGFTPLDVERAYERKGLEFQKKDDQRAHIRHPNFPNPYP